MAIGFGYSWQTPGLFSVLDQPSRGQGWGRVETEGKKAPHLRYKCSDNVRQSLASNLNVNCEQIAKSQ